MLTIVLLILILFWFMGYGPLLALRIPLLHLMGHTINLWDILIFLLIIWIIDLLPGLLRSVAAVILVIWLLSLFGFIVIPMLSNLLVIAIIVGVGLYLLGGH